MNRIFSVGICLAVIFFTGCSVAGKSFYPGSYIDGAYESTWLGLRFQPQNAELVIADFKALVDIMKLNKSFKEKSNESTGKLEIDYSTVPMAYEMSARGEAGSVLITADDFRVTGFDAREYISKKYLSDIVQRYGESQFSYEFAENVELAGKSYSMADIVVTTQLGNTYRRIYVAKLGDRVANITIDYNTLDGLNKIKSCFFEVE